jgi:hypothetical protein
MEADIVAAYDQLRKEMVETLQMTADAQADETLQMTADAPADETLHVTADPDVNVVKHELLQQLCMYHSDSSDDDKSDIHIRAGLIEEPEEQDYFSHGEEFAIDNFANNFISNDTLLLKTELVEMRLALEKLTISVDAIKECLLSIAKK